MAEPRTRYPIDDVLVGRLGVVPGDVVVELGCGRGFALGAAAEQAGDLVVLGLDADEEALGLAQGVLDAAPGTGHVALADLDSTLPLATGSVSKVLCHNVLEQLADPAALLEEASRVLRAGGRSVWSHTDFESVVISGGDPALTRQVVAAYADALEPGGRHSDGRMGRKLAGLVQASPLVRISVDAHVLLRTELSGLAELRVRSIFAVLRDAARDGTTDVTVDELEGWMAGLRQADDVGRFLYAHTTFVVVASTPGS